MSVGLLRRETSREQLRQWYNVSIVYYLTPCTTLQYSVCCHWSWYTRDGRAWHRPCQAHILVWIWWQDIHMCRGAGGQYRDVASWTRLWWRGRAASQGVHLGPMICAAHFCHERTSSAYLFFGYNDRQPHRRRKLSQEKVETKGSEEHTSGESSNSPPVVGKRKCGSASRKTPSQTTSGIANHFQAGKPWILLMQHYFQTRVKQRGRRFWRELRD